MNKDITSRKDIELIVQKFYEEAIHDNHIGHFFTEVVALNLQLHLPIICDFWETTLLGNIVYKGNPMLKHLSLAEKTTLNKSHFEKWLALWEKTVRDHFEGRITQEAITRARQIASLMQFKIQQLTDNQ